MSPRLSWGLCVTTYQRRELLGRCVTQALSQTRAPSEIVIVDTSPDFDENRRHVAEIVRARAPEVRFEYALGVAPNQPGKRNEAVRLATADVLFMIDDDSLMYPDCAEKIMEVYERPGCESVVAVMASLHALPPDELRSESEPAEPPSGLLPLAARASRWLKGSFHPEFVERPSIPTPELPAGAHRVMDLHGARITARRAAVLKRPFDGALLLNAHEDRDAAWNLGGIGVLAELDARLVCHVEAARPGGGERRGFLTRGAWLLNYAYLVRKWCPSHEELAARKIRRFARSMLLLDAINAARTRSAARLRGVTFVYTALLPKLLRAPQRDLAEVLMAASRELEARSRRP